MYIYEGVKRSNEIAAAVGLSHRTIQRVRWADKWPDFANQAQAKAQADRVGLSLPFLLRSSGMASQRDAEEVSRAIRAGDIRVEIEQLVAAMVHCRAKDSPQYARLVSGVAALQSLLDSLLGLDVAKRVAQAAALARSKVRRQVAGVACFGRRPLPVAPSSPQPEPDLQVLMP